MEYTASSYAEDKAHEHTNKGNPSCEASVLVRVIFREICTLFVFYFGVNRSCQV